MEPPELRCGFAATGAMNRRRVSPPPTTPGRKTACWSSSGESMSISVITEPRPAPATFAKPRKPSSTSWCDGAGLDQLPAGSRVLDVGCGIGGSARILARDYGLNVLGISISPAQVERATQLTPSGLSCRFQVMDALDLQLPDQTFDCLLYTSPSPRDYAASRMPSSA